MLTAHPSFLDRPAILGKIDWSWRQVHTAALELADRIPGESTVCNLCSSRAGFLVAWLAALRRGCTQLLPPSGGQFELLSMLQSSAHPMIVVDSESLLEPAWTEQAQCMVLRTVPPASCSRDESLAWQPSWDTPSIRLYTSGSTGKPEAQVKTIGQLARGAEALRARLEKEIAGGFAALERIVSSVPPQHMFGLETSVMLPLVTGLPVQDGQPLLPADIREALEARTMRAAWIATPVHLRAVAESGESLSSCEVVITSTMSLAPALAARIESCAAAPVLEIYGSTETGAMAMRRTRDESDWTPLRDVRVESLADGTRAWGGHFASPQLLADQVEIHASGSFRLVGRHSDVLKIAGRRASLAGLNLMLQDLPGLGDGVFYLPASGSPTERLVLIYSGDRLERPAALKWLRERMDAVFVPRALIHVDSLPRNSASKLPRAALDEIYAAWKAAKASA